MPKIVNVARHQDRNGYPLIIARVSDKAYRYCNAAGSFSNTARTGDRNCTHMAESEARKLIREDRGHHSGHPFHVPATDQRFKSRITAMGAAVLEQRQA